MASGQNVTVPQFFSWADTKASEPHHQHGLSLMDHPCGWEWQRNPIQNLIWNQKHFQSPMTLVSRGECNNPDVWIVKVTLLRDCSHRKVTNIAFAPPPGLRNYKSPEMHFFLLVIITVKIISYQISELKQCTTNTSIRYKFQHSELKPISILQIVATVREALRW